MRLNTVRLTYQTGETWTLYPLGDVHFGSANCDKDLFDAVSSCTATATTASSLTLTAASAIPTSTRSWKGWRRGTDASG